MFSRLQRCHILTLIWVAIISMYVPSFYLAMFGSGNLNQGSQQFWKVEDWKNISSRQMPEKFFVYSAFYDYLGGDAVIKVLGGTIPTAQRKLYCHLFDLAELHYDTVASTIQITRHASRELKISPVTIFCKLYGLKYLPSYISISPHRIPEKFDNKLIRVITNNPYDHLGTTDKKRLPVPMKFSACVQPTYDYDNVWQFLQWIEFQMMMGVEHFTFYNISIGPQISCLIEHYNSSPRSELIEVLPWQNIRHIPELHNNGQVVQATDCVARYKNRSKFVIILDFDEYIIPRQNLTQEVNNYNQLVQFTIAHLDYKGHIPVQFQFRSGLFGLGFPEFEDNFKTEGIESNKIVNKLSLLKHVTRLKQIKPFHYRSKFITMPDFVTEPGIHSMVHAIPKNGIELLVPESIAYVHHYRKCNWAEDCGGKEIVEDKTGHFWVKKLLARVVKRYQVAKDLCGIQL